MTQVGAAAMRQGLARITALFGHDAWVTITTTPRGVTLRAHDWEGVLEWYVGGEPDKSGSSSTVPARLAKRLLRGLTDVADLTATTARLTVNGATVAAHEDGDPLVTPRPWVDAMRDVAWQHTIDHQMLAKSLTWCVVAVRRDRERPILTSLAITAKGFMAADNYRIHLADWPTGIVGHRDETVLVQASLVDALRAALSGSVAGPVSYAHVQPEGHGPATVWQVGQHLMVYRDQDGQYPNVAQVIPTADDTADTWVTDAAALGAIRRAAALAPEGVARWHGGDVSLAWDDIEYKGETPGGPHSSTGFRSEYLAAAIRGAEGPVTFTAHGPLSPLLVEHLPTGPGPTLRAVIMPVRTAS